MKLYFVIFIYLISNQTLAQTSTYPPDSRELLLKGIEYHEKGNYKSAIKQYNKVHHCDTNYALALYEKAFSQWKNESYDEALTTVSEAFLISTDANRKDLLELRANIFDDQKQYARAQEIYLGILKEFPFSYLTHYNLGLSYKNEGKVQLAVNECKTALGLNPYHKRSWLMLADIARESGQTALAALFYNMYLCLNPVDSKEELLAFSEMMSLGITTEVTPLVFTDNDKAFEDLNEKLNNRLGLNKSYKVKSTFSKVALVRQNFLLISELGSVQIKDPLFNDIKFVLSKVLSDNKFDLFMGLAMASSNSSEIQQKISSKISKIKQMAPYLNTLFAESFSKLETTTKAGKTIAVKQYYATDEFFATKKTLSYRREEAKTGGNWTIQFFNEDGYLFSEGAMNDELEKQGLWHKYDSKGNILENINYNKGKIDGPFSIYNAYGFVIQKGNFKNGEKSGTEFLYYPNGILKEQTEYKAGNISGKVKSYDNLGKLSSVYEVKDEALNGDVLIFYSDSTLKRRYKMVNGLEEGDYFEYYENGKTKIEIHIFKAGKVTGDRIEYHRNGNIKQKTTYLDGNITGTDVHYYSDGTKSKENKYGANGKLHGICASYNREGNRYIEIEYDDGELVSYSYYKSNGELHHTDEVKRKKLPVRNYYEDGIVANFGLDLKGVKQGEWKYYNEYGRLTAVEMYEKGKLIGNKKEFGGDSVLTGSYQYSDGEIHGYAEEFYLNGKKQRYGNYTNGNIGGFWFSLNPDGTLRKETFYNSTGSAVGYNFQYTNKGKLCEAYYYDKAGTEKFVMHFDTAGNALDTISLKGGTGLYEGHLPNGAIWKQQHYINWRLHGKFRYAYPNGKDQIVGEYFSGERHGHWAWYYPNGQLRVEKDYHMDNMVGTVKSWHFNGKLAGEYQVDADGEWFGEAKEYNNKGVLIELNNYKYGEIHGERIQYNDDGQLELIRYYYFGKLIGYSYHNAQGKPVPMIPLSNGSGHVKSYFPNGKVAREFHIDRGNFEGLYVVYWPNGKVRDSFNNVAGDLEGTRIKYYSSGQVKSIEPHTLDEFHGICRYYHENGKLREEVEYAFGDQEGAHRIFDSSGKLLHDMYYFNGNCIYMK